MLSDDAFREQLLDYLYDALDDDARAAFERALDDAPARQMEVARMRVTLARARTGLAALAEDPPTRVRDAVIAEARRAVARRDVRPLRGLHAAKRTAAWLVPALGVAAAVTFVVLRKGDEAGAPMRAREAPAEVPATAPAGGKGAPTPDEASREEAPSLESAAPARRRAAPSAKPKGATAPREVEGLGGLAPPSSGARSEKAHRTGARGAAEVEAPAAAPAAAADEAVRAESREQKRDEAPERAPDARVRAAERLVREGRADEALEAYRALLERFPDDPRAGTWRARASALRDAQR